MATAAETNLWRVSLGRECPGKEAEEFRQRLISAHARMAERATTLAGEIARDLPEFTVHDASHSDALWGLADRIGGSHLTLNPVEAFVFGAAVLVHDLGMASAAYVNGLDALREEPRWSDTVASVLRQKTGSIPTEVEIAEPEEWVVDAATERILRDLHAQHAEQLATATWTDHHGNQYALLEDVDLREALGPIVGKVAHSHWWPVRQLAESFGGDLGAPPGASSGWTVRPLILACLLRLADASHLDGSRAPRFLRVLRAPRDEAERHWTFQEHLAQPLLEEDRMVFTGTAFGVEETEAWWLCADTLSMVDREFRAVDSLLADRRLPRFAARGVTGGDDPVTLAAHIPTAGWSPIDAKVRVTNVVRLVERLGGRELYGSKPEIPLRELIQNASDSVRARRIVDELDADAGKIVVSVTDSEKEGWQWLEVEDSGLGMSREVLTNHLLDFGVSFWESERVIDEFPGLLASRFEPVGKFGIGFFSVFMWGDDVDVISRRHDASRAETHVLEFRGGVAKRPLLREATVKERMREPGTRVRILLDDETIWRLGLDPGEPKTPVLSALCGWLAPALDVDIDIEEDGVREVAVKARDWVTMPLAELGQRIQRSPVRRSAEYPPAATPGETEGAVAIRRLGEEAQQREREEALRGLDACARLLEDDGEEVIGRLAISDLMNGVTVVGGLRATSLYRVTGILFARPTTASRNAGLPLVSAASLAAWATEQAGLVDGLDPTEAMAVASVVLTCGGDTGDLPIATATAGPLSVSEIERWAAEHDEILVLHDAALSNEERAGGKIELLDRVISVAVAPASLVLTSLGGEDWDPQVDHWPLSLWGDGLKMRRSAAPLGGLSKAVARAWDLPEDVDILGLLPYTPTVVGQRDGAEVELDAFVWRRDGTG